MHSIKEKIRSVEMKSAQNDMTVGNPMKIIFGFTLPIFIGNVFQQFYNMADAVIVGKFVGNKALAAVGSTGTIMFLIYGFVVGMTAGFTVLTAQKFGAGDMKGMRKTSSGSGNSFFCSRGTSDDTVYGIYETASDPYEYAVGYFCGRIFIHNDRQRRNPGTDAL